MPGLNLCHTSHIRSHAEAGGGREGEECKAFLGETWRQREKVGRERETGGKKAGKERRQNKGQPNAFYVVPSVGVKADAQFCTL